jgi:NAD(P)-dependent dehydrogenase (short-subunit alcohol dehydrogenase family)
VNDSLAGKQVVITGGRGALGSAVVEAFVAAGAGCHLPERGAAPSSPRPGVQVSAGVDLTSEEAVSRYYAALPPLWASIHLAGGYAGGPILQMTAADLREQLDQNLMTTFLCCREAVRRMSGAGRIVNVSSRAPLAPAGGSLAYTAAKGAVNAFTQALAEEVKKQGILVNAVAPGTIDTPKNRAAMPSADHTRWTRPEEIARAILWLASPDNAVTSGAIVPVFGRS